MRQAFFPTAKFGQTVHTGTHLGDILDPLDVSVATSIDLNCEGLLFTLREYPIVYGGSLLGRILKKPDAEGKAGGT